MKIKAETFLNTKKKITSKKIFITGSDESLIFYTKQFVINSFKKENFFIDTSGIYNSGVVGNLFSEKKTLFILDDINKNDISELQELESCSVLAISLNGKKANLIKSALTKLKDWLIIECYTLNRKTKQIVLKSFVEDNKISLSNDVFWYVVENFDNNFVVFVKQLELLLLFNNKIDSIADIEKITFVENKIEINKIFFNIFNSNNFLTEVFIKNMNSVSDFYSFLGSIKLYLGIISESHNKESALTKFPKYLFAEKDVFLKIYSKLNKEKLAKIYKIFSRAEVLARKNSNLYSVIGLRFFLNLKKIITS